MSKYLGDDFDKWTNQWEKAQADGVFEDAPKPPAPPTQEPDFFGNYRPNKDVTDIKDVDSDYWNHVYKLSRHAGDSPDPLEELQPINEDKATNFTLVQTTKSDNKSSGKITDELGGLPNPNNRTNRGEDQRRRVTPNWAGGDEIQELQFMKMNLEQLESKINAAEGLGNMKKMKSLISKMESLRKQIDELSDGIPPEFKTEYLS